MELPIFGDCEGDMAWFSSVAEAESWIEPFGFKEGLWTIYDASGQLIEAEMRKRKEFFGLVVMEYVTLIPVNDGPVRANELCDKLIYMLTHLGISTESLIHASLQEVEEMFMKAYEKG